MKKAVYILVLVLNMLKVYGQSEHILASYKFSGNTIDEIGSNDGTCINAFLSTDRFNNENSAYQFSAKDTSAISLGDNYDIFSQTDSKFSFSFWFKSTDTTQINRLLISKYGNNHCSENQREFLIRINNFKKPEIMYFSTLTTDSYRIIEGQTFVNDTNWHHLAISYDGSIDSQNGLDRVKMYLDNVEQETILRLSKGLLGNIQNSTAHLGIGTSLSSIGEVCSEIDTAFVFNGLIDDIKIYEGILDSVEIQELYYEDLCYEVVYDTIQYVDTIQYIDTVQHVDTIQYTDTIQYIDTIQHVDTIQYFDTICYYDTVEISVTDTLFIDLKTTNTDENVIKSKVKVYPNPTSEVLHINIEDTENFSEYSLRIVDTQFKTIFETMMTEEHYQIALNKFGNTGLYLVLVFDPNNLLIDTKKIILE